MKWYLKVLKNYAVFDGRARRKEYWMFFLFNSIISFVFSFICAYNGAPEAANIYTLFILIPSLAVGVRRMHDVGKSGWFIIVPIYNFILSVSKGNIGSNKYGSDPKEFD